MTHFELKELREKFIGGDHISQEKVDSLLNLLEEDREKFRPSDKSEILELVNKEGNYRNIVAPRWLCHLLGLRHRCVHILLRWNSPGLGNVFVLQIRDWAKPVSPGHLDISVGGHVSGKGSPNYIEAAYRELEEELGITAKDLKNEQLIYCSGYESYDEISSENFFNREWRDVFIAELTNKGFDRIKFEDGEVVGLYLCPEREAAKLLNQTILPLASALKYSLPICLDLPTASLDI